MRTTLWILAGLAACGTTSDADTSSATQDSLRNCDHVGISVPTGRGEIEGVWDAQRKRLVMFGGNEAVPINCSPGATAFLGETWVYESQCDGFAQISTESAPHARGRHAAALDEAGGQMLIHGGRFRNGDSGDYTLYGDTWAFDFELETWTKLAGPGGGPSKRGNHGAVVAQDALVVFGGNDSDNGAVFSPLNDTWTLDLGTLQWNRLETTNKPPARLYPAVATDGSTLYVYGGGDENALFGTGFFGDLWALDLTTGQWTELNDGTGNAPVDRFWAGLEHDPNGNRLILFAGHDSGDLGNTNQVWSFNLETQKWKTLHEGDTYSSPANGQCDFPADFTDIDDTSPERRNAGVVTRGDDQLVIFGGKTDCGNANDVWALDLTTDTWTEWSRATAGEVCLRANQTCSTLCF